MIRPEVTRLYKYRAFNQHALSSLRDRTGWFALPSSFNDPFDCALTISESEIERDVQYSIEHLVNTGQFGRDVVDDDFEVKDSDREAHVLARKKLLDAAQKLGIFCLSETCQDILMWSHYSCCHAGFCVEYGRRPDNTLGRLASPVIYSDSYPSLSLSDLSDRSNGPSPSDVLWQTKSTHWSYEREWRIMQHPGGKLYSFDFPITGIVFGMRMPEAQRTTIYNVLASDREVTFRQAIASANRFDVELVDWKP